MCTPLKHLSGVIARQAFTLTPLNQVVSEGNSADFELTLDAVSRVPESVIVTSESGTATIGSDFMQRTERITFFPGETTKSFLSPNAPRPCGVD